MYRKWSPIIKNPTSCIDFCSKWNNVELFGFEFIFLLKKAHDCFSCNWKIIKLTSCYYKNGLRKKGIMDKCILCMLIQLFVVSATIKTCSNNSWSESTEGESKFSTNLIWWWGFLCVGVFLIYLFLPINFTKSRLDAKGSNLF